MTKRIHAPHAPSQPDRFNKIARKVDGLKKNVHSLWILTGGMLILLAFLVLVFILWL